MNLIAHLTRQVAFSRATFGPGAREQGVIDHIRKELVEIGGEPGPSELEGLVRDMLRTNSVGSRSAVRAELLRLDEARKRPPEPDDGSKPKEWVDVVLLALDGLWRSLMAAGCLWADIPSRAVFLIDSKQSQNEQRDWPDWRTADPTKAIEHDRSGEGGR